MYLSALTEQQQNSKVFSIIFVTHFILRFLGFFCTQHASLIIFLLQYHDREDTTCSPFLSQQPIVSQL